MTDDPFNSSDEPFDDISPGDDDIVFDDLDSEDLDRASFFDELGDDDIMSQDFDDDVSDDDSDFDPSLWQPAKPRSAADLVVAEPSDDIELVIDASQEPMSELPPDVSILEADESDHGDTQDNVDETKTEDISFSGSEDDNIAATTLDRPNLINSSADPLTNDPAEEPVTPPAITPNPPPILTNPFDVPASMENEDIEPPLPPVYHYRIALVLPTELEAFLNQVREGVGLPILEMGHYGLMPNFKVDDVESIEMLLGDWVQANLPLTAELETIDGHVVGQQRYIAAINFAEGNPLPKAQALLAQQVTPQVELISKVGFAPFFVVSDNTPENKFPYLLHALQRNFDPLEWTIDRVELLRVPEGDDRWEVHEVFHAL